MPDQNEGSTQATMPATAIRYRSSVVLETVCMCGSINRIAYYSPSGKPLEEFERFSCRLNRLIRISVELDGNEAAVGFFEQGKKFFEVHVPGTGDEVKVLPVLDVLEVHMKYPALEELHRELRVFAEHMAVSEIEVGAKVLRAYLVYKARELGA